MTIEAFKELGVAYGELLEVSETFETGEHFILYFAGESTPCTVLFGTKRHAGRVENERPFALSIIEVSRPKTKK